MTTNVVVCLVLVAIAAALGVAEHRRARREPSRAACRFDRGGWLPPSVVIPVCPDCDEPHPWTHDDGSDDERPY